MLYLLIKTEFSNPNTLANIRLTFKVGLRLFFLAKLACSFLSRSLAAAARLVLLLKRFLSQASACIELSSVISCLFLKTRTLLDIEVRRFSFVFAPRACQQNRSQTQFRHLFSPSDMKPNTEYSASFSISALGGKMMTSINY